MRKVVGGLAALVMLGWGCSNLDSGSAGAPPGPPLGPPSGTTAVSSKAEAGVASTVTNLPVNLNAGWNGVGFQAQQLTALSANASIAGLAIWNGAGYNTANFSTQTVNANPGKAFFVFATGATSFTYSGNDPSPTAVDLSVNGYNLVSFANSAPINGARLVASQNGQIVPLGSVVLTAFTVIGANNAYSQIDVSNGGVIPPGAALWVFANTANGPIRLSLSTPGASPTPFPSVAPSVQPSVQPSVAPSVSPGASPAPSPSPSAVTNTSVAVPITNFTAGTNVTSANGSESGIWVSVGGGPPFLALLDTGSDAFAPSSSVVGPDVQMTNTTLSGYYDVCRSTRSGRLAFGNISILPGPSPNASPLVVTQTAPILVCQDNQNSSIAPCQGVFGLRMNGGYGATSGNWPTASGPLLSAKLFLPPPLNQMFVYDRPKGFMHFGTFPTSQFSTVQLNTMPCNATVPGGLPCWDDGAVPTNVTVGNTSLEMNGLLDTGAGTRLQYLKEAPPYVQSAGTVVTSNVSASVQTTTGRLSLPLTSRVTLDQNVASGGNVCNGEIINVGNAYPNFYQVLYDQVHGLIGFRPSSP